MGATLDLWGAPVVPADPFTPAERLKQQGARALSDAELLSLMLRPSARRSCLEMSRALLAEVNNDLSQLGRLTLEDVMRYAGTGEVGAVVLLGALELGRRRREDGGRDRRLIASSAAAYEELRPVLADLPHEQFWLLLLDRGNRVTHRVQVSDGGMHGTVADPKRIFKVALDRQAASMVLAHNHPSGQLRPSSEDIALTKKLVEGARLLDLAVQDHLVCCEHGYYSFADNGML